MMSIFNFFGSVLGYLLWFLYTVFKNYGIAIILFTIIVKALMFPFSIKSQKSMAAQSRLASKQQELQKKYAKDQMKYNEEHGITPQTIKKAVRDLIAISKAVENPYAADTKDPESMDEKELKKLAKELEKKMRQAAAELNFEEAASLRDRMIGVKKMLLDME